MFDLVKRKFSPTAPNQLWIADEGAALDIPAPLLAVPRQHQRRSARRRGAERSECFSLIFLLGRPVREARSAIVPVDVIRSSEALLAAGNLGSRIGNVQPFTSAFRKLCSP
jgi:hypothetical protein